jgi:hypothetical protein
MLVEQQHRIGGAMNGKAPPIDMQGKGTTTGSTDKSTLTGRMKLTSARQRLEDLNAMFGPYHFEHGRMVITVARDLTGTMKLAHRLQSRVQQCFGTQVEVIMEHMKYELWQKMHEATAEMGMYKGSEVPECQVTHIPDGIRVHPYKRSQMPTLELLLLWEDPGLGRTRGHCLYSVSHPDIPSLDQCDEIFAFIEPVFEKRRLHVELRKGAPIRGEFDDVSPSEYDTLVGAGVPVTLLACHPHGFASDRPDGQSVAHVTQCQPLAFHGFSDEAGYAKICFLPADTNKIVVNETELFHGTEVLLLGSKVNAMEDGPTLVQVELMPKAVCSVYVHVFPLPDRLPDAEETDGIIDWSSEERKCLHNALVQATPLKDDASAVPFHHKGSEAWGNDVFVPGSCIPEGCVTINVSCPGYEAEERVMQLLAGDNEFYIPLRQAKGHTICVDGI